MLVGWRLKDTEDEVELDRTLFGFFDRCFKLNQVISQHDHFLKFFERWDKYRFLIKKKAYRKNEVTRNLSACVLEKFNGYETIRNALARKEQRDFEAINIFYESNYDASTLVPDYFTDEIHLAYKSYVGRFDKEKNIE